MEKETSKKRIACAIGKTGNKRLINIHNVKSYTPLCTTFTTRFTHTFPLPHLERSRISTSCNISRNEKKKFLAQFTLLAFIANAKREPSSWIRESRKTRKRALKQSRPRPPFIRDARWPTRARFDCIRARSHRVTVIISTPINRCEKQFRQASRTFPFLRFDNTRLPASTFPRISNFEKKFFHAYYTQDLTRLRSRVFDSFSLLENFYRVLS